MPVKVKRAPRRNVGPAVEKYPMRFLVIEEPKDSFLNLDPDISTELVESHLEVLRKLNDEGKIIESSCFVHSAGGFAIYEVESLEELHDSLMDTPLGPFYDRQVYPLTKLKRGIRTVEYRKAEIDKFEK